MTDEEKNMPDDLAALDASLEAELAATRDREEGHRVDPGPTGFVVSVAMVALLGGLLLPWTGSVAGWEVLAGLAPLGLLPPLHAGFSLGFGLVCSALALATRWWALAWLTAAGCAVSVVTGVWAIWSRQIGVPAGGTGAGIGLVLSVLAVVVLAGSWARISTRR